jgi:hypothetical protein
VANPVKLSLNLYPSIELRHALDRWRIDQPDAPARAVAGRRQLEEALTGKGYFNPPTSLENPTKTTPKTRAKKPKSLFE